MKKKPNYIEEAEEFIKRGSHTVWPLHEKLKGFLYNEEEAILGFGRYLDRLVDK